MATEDRPPITAGAERTHWFIIEARNLLNPVLTTTAGVFLTLWTSKSGELFSMPHMRWLIAALAVAGVWLWGYFSWLRPKYSELAKQKAQIEIELKDARRALQAALDSLLLHLLKDMKMHNPSYRISAYSVEGDMFVLLSRRSQNAGYERRGRPAYPLNQGVIGKAWNLCSATNNFNVDTREEWESELVSSGNFTVEEARALTMFSPSVVAVRVDAPDDSPVGMVVIESGLSDGFKPNTISTLRGRATFNAVTSLITGWHEHFPRAKEYKSESENGKTENLLVEPKWKTAPQPASMDQVEPV